MNDVRLHVPYIFGNKQNSKTEGETEKSEAGEQTPQILKIGTTEERPAVGQDKQERGKAKAR